MFPDPCPRCAGGQCNPCKTIGDDKFLLNKFPTDSADPPLAVIFEPDNARPVAAFIPSAKSFIDVFPDAKIVLDAECGVYVLRTAPQHVRCRYPIAAVLMRVMSRKFVIADQLGRQYLYRFVMSLGAPEKIMDEIRAILPTDHIVDSNNDDSVAKYNKFPDVFTL